jgi:hypothetical protein
MEERAGNNRSAGRPDRRDKGATLAEVLAGLLSGPRRLDCARPGANSGLKKGCSGKELSTFPFENALAEWLPVIPLFRSTGSGAES